MMVWDSVVGCDSVWIFGGEEEILGGAEDREETDSQEFFPLRMC